MSEIYFTLTPLELFQLKRLALYYRRHTTPVDLNPHHPPVSVATIVAAAIAITYEATLYTQPNDLVEVSSSKETFYLSPPTYEAWTRFPFRLSQLIIVSPRTLHKLRLICDHEGISNEDIAVAHCLSYFDELTNFVKGGGLVYIPNLTYLGAHHYNPKFPALLDYADLYLYKKLSPATNKTTPLSA